MTDQEFKDLEALLSKLKQYVGANFCISAPYYQDGTYMAVYGEKGFVIANNIGPDIKSVADKLKVEISNKQTKKVYDVG